MREPLAGLPDATLHAALRAHYGLAATAVTWLPLGLDAAAWVYRVETAGGAPYFLKVRRQLTNLPGLLVPRYLHNQGVAQVVAPLPTATQTLWAEVEGYTLVLYPFIAGPTGKEAGMTPQQWTALGAALRHIHTTAIAPELAGIMQRESFVPDGAATLRAVDALVDGRAVAGPAAQALAAFWQARRDDLHTLLERAEDLGRRLAQRAPAFVLCHTDIHTNNVLLDAGGWIWIVDWDETLLAPKERDLMFVVGGGLSTAMVGPRDEEQFLQGYGPAALDPLALAYYRYARAVSDISYNCEQVCFRPDLGDGMKRTAVDHLRQLFLPGRIVALAFASDGPGA